MDANLKLPFSLTGDNARLHYPREDGLLSLGLFKQMSADFVVLGRNVGACLAASCREQEIAVAQLAKDLPTNTLTP